MQKEESKVSTESESLPKLPNNEIGTKIESDLKNRAIGKAKNGNVRYPSDPFKYKYMINRHEKLDIHCNLFDSSFVEYSELSILNLQTKYFQKKLNSQLFKKCFDPSNSF